jgi:hypothetical protein
LQRQHRRPPQLLQRRHDLPVKQVTAEHRGRLGLQIGLDLVGLAAAGQRGRAQRAGAVKGVATGNLGIGKDGEPTEGFQLGIARALLLCVDDGRTLGLVVRVLP